MAVLQTMRTKFGLAISILVALGLLSFIIDPTQVESALNSMSSKYDVGEINGKSISYNDFQDEVENYTTITEMLTGSSASSAEQQQQVRNAAWQGLMDKYLFVKNAKAAGLRVGDAEMVELTTGENISPVILQSGVFSDQNGNFNAENVVNFVQNISSDETGRLKQYWDYLQNTVYNQQFYQKYGALFTYSNTDNALTLAKAVEENNNTANVDFVMVPNTYATDSTIVVSDSEIKNYYNSHKKFFKQTANRDIEYVVFEVVPSQDDINEASSKVTDVYDEFCTTDNMKSFLLKNSDRSLSSYWFKEGELNAISKDVNDYAFGADAKSASPIFKSGNTFYAARVMDSAMLSDSVYVKHILLQGDDSDHLADSLCTVASQKGTNFSNLVALYSADQNSSAGGELGNIGWMTQTYMIPGFESVITAEAGKPFVIKTQYGTHVVMVSQKTKPVLKKQVAILEKTTLASNQTFNEYYAKANKFATIANGNYENYRAAVDTMGVYSHPMNHVTEATESYGAIDNAKEVTRWIFENKKGKVSNIITVNQNYFFVTVIKDIHEEGYAKVDEVAPSIRQQLYAEKLSEKKAADVAEQIKGLNSLDEIAEKLGTSISSETGVAFSSLSSRSLDPKFVGAVSVAPEGQICGPVAGTIGTYVFKVTGRDVASFYTEDDAKTFQTQKNQYNSQMIVPVMSADAEVVDHRARFF
jgi:peptidyl-prolyl cis-trans isomerase D